MKEDEIVIRYKAENKGRINLFSDEFVKRNLNICKIKINNEIVNLISYYDYSENQNNFIEIKLIGVNSIIDASQMFYKCNSLLSVDCSSWNTKKLRNMNSMFNWCKSLKTINNISHFDTSNVQDMSLLFNRCVSLSSIDDISKWNTSKVKDISLMFSECKNLSK